MDPITGLVASLALAGVMGGLLVRFDDRWHRRARDLGLTLHGQPLRLEGAWRGLPCRVVRDEESTVGGRGLRVYLGPVPDLPTDVLLRHVLPHETGWGGRHGATEPTGDATFDASVVVRGEQPWLTPALDVKTRRLVWPLLKQGGLVAAGCVSAHVSGLSPSPARLRESLDTAHRVAKALAFPPEARPRRLASKALDDPDWTCGHRAIEQFINDYKGFRQDDADRERDLADRSAVFRLAAALHLRGAAADDTLADLATKTDVYRVATRAMDGLIARDPARAGHVAAAMLAGPRTAFNVRAWSALAASPDARHRALLLDLTPEQSSRNAYSLVQVLATLGPAAEPQLIAILANDDPFTLRMLSHELGQLGTRAAVAPLLERAEAPKMEPKARQALLEAVRRIQSRLEGDGGQLSLAEPRAEGALSLADDERHR